MKKSMQIFSHIIACILLGAFSIQFNSSPVFIPSFFMIYAICFIACPILSLINMKRLLKFTFYFFTIAILTVGIFLCTFLFGNIAATVLTSVAAVLYGTLRVRYDLPLETKETKHLETRGLTTSHAKRIVLLRQSFAFFFYNSGSIASLIAVYTLFSFGSLSYNTILSVGFSVALIGFIGKLLYGLLGSPVCANKTSASRKGAYITASLLSFVFIIITVYVYVGSLHASSDPALISALTVCKDILTPSCFGVMAAIIGILIGLFLSLIATRFFAIISGAVKIISPVLLSALIYSLTHVNMLYATAASVSVPLLISGIYVVLSCKLQLIPYKELPLLDRKKVLIKPLVTKPVLGAIPVMLTEALLSSAFINIALCNSLQTLSSISKNLTLIILSFLFIILYVICILTKEVRHNG